VYTQCSKCETVFKLSAEVLRAAGGQVRCGRCGEVFNALVRLAEDTTAFTAGESSLDLEARADSILETIVPPQVAHTMAQDYEDFVPPGVELAQLEVLDWTEEDQAQRLDAERSMEFTLPPGELDRIFIESKMRALQPMPPAATEAEAVVEPVSEATPQLDDAREIEQEAEAAQAQMQTPLQGQAQPPTLALAPAQTQARAQSQTPTQSQALTQSQPLAQHPESAALDHQFISGLEVPEHVRQDMLAGLEPRVEPAGVSSYSARRGRRWRLILWLGAAIVLTLLLMAQSVHQNREWFTAHAHGPFSAVVRALYGAMGAPLPAPASLSAYQLRQWGITGDPDANGTLRLRASILNTASQLQPYPLLRVTLADRFGKGIGRRDFDPAEYLGKPTAKLLAPGERVDAILEILDPGKNAEGFEIDVCLRGVDQRVACQSDAAPQASR
jgi:predicted Zn finger-like uncharacterized protein